jgi:hypothetical protein
VISICSMQIFCHTTTANNWKSSRFYSLLLIKGVFELTTVVLLLYISHRPYFIVRVLKISTNRRNKGQIWSNSKYFFKYFPIHTVAVNGRLIKTGAEQILLVKMASLTKHWHEILTDD